MIFDVNYPSSDQTKGDLSKAWSKIELEHTLAVADAKLLTDEEFNETKNRPSQPTPEEKLRLEKTYLLKTFGEELIEAMTLEHEETGQILRGYAAMVLKNERGIYRNQLESFYLLTSDKSEALAKDLSREYSQLRHGEGRFIPDVSWKTRQRQCREFLGLLPILDPEKWWEPKDFSQLAHKARKYAPMVKDVLGFSVDSDKMNDAQIVTQLVEDLGLKFEKKWASRTLANGKRFKKRRIDRQSREYALMYVKHRQTVKQQLLEKQQQIEREVEQVECWAELTQITVLEESLPELESIQKQAVADPVVESVQLSVFAQQPEVEVEEAIATQEEAQPPMELTVSLNPTKQLAVGDAVFVKPEILHQSQLALAFWGKM